MADLVVQNEAQAQLLKDTLCSKLTVDEFRLFSAICEHTGLNPVTRQIYAIKRGDKVTYQTSIDGYRAIAQRTGLYIGQKIFWCGKDGAWLDVWTGDEDPHAAKCLVYKKGSAEPFESVCLVKSFRVSSNQLWKTMCEHMIGIRAEAHALRKAFPEAMAGVYTKEEMDNPAQQAMSVRDNLQAKPAHATELLGPPVYIGTLEQKKMLNSIFIAMDIDPDSRADLAERLKEMRVACDMEVLKATVRDLVLM